MGPDWKTFEIYRNAGAVAGNVLFQLGGKDNNLGNIGKVILDNIISGKFRRDVSILSQSVNLEIVSGTINWQVDPFVPTGGGGGGFSGGGGGEPPRPIPQGEVVDFYAERDRCLQV